MTLVMNKTLSMQQVTGMRFLLGLTDDIELVLTLHQRIVNAIHCNWSLNISGRGILAPLILPQPV
jgi:hypothetical protein